MKERLTHQSPALVPGTAGAKQAGQVPVKVARRARWAWAEATVWTDRMLATLEYGVQGGLNAFFARMRLFSLEQAHIRECQSMKMAH